MNTEFEKLIVTLFNSEAISPYDKLSDEIKSFKQAELSQEELELVAAAGFGNYEKFKNLYMKNK